MQRRAAGKAVEAVGHRELVEKLVRWAAPGGALYLELTVPELLEDFNGSEFAAEAGARVSLQSTDGVRRDYRDGGGVHRMMSPGLEFFTGPIAPHFAGTSHACGGPGDTPVRRLGEAARLRGRAAAAEPMMPSPVRVPPLSQ